MPVRRSFVVILAVFSSIFIPHVRAAETVEFPSFSAVVGDVQHVLANTADYKPGDLFTREHAESIFDALKKLGWDVSTREKLLARIPTRNDSLGTVLSGERGQEFMRKIATYPEGFDRVDNLMKLPDGQKIVKRLIQGKDGDKLIEYLTTSEGGKNLGKMLGKTAHTAFNQPTGRIYTAKALVLELEQQYPIDRKRADPNGR